MTPRPPGDLPGLDPAWSRRILVPDADGTPRRWHLLDNQVAPDQGTVLCVHGNPTWSYLWRRFLAAAPPGWRVVAPDQLGMGWSERLTRPRTMAERIDDLERLSDALGIEGPVVLVAHDWGGPIGLGWALRLHARRPERLRAVVLTNTGVALPADQLPAVIRLARNPRLRDLVCVRSAAFVRGATAVSHPALPREVRDTLASPYRTRLRRHAVGDFVADIPVEEDHPSKPALDAVVAGLPTLADVPTLLLWGPRDPVFSDTYLNDVLDRLPHADVHRYPGASHLVMEDRPETAAHAWAWLTDRRPVEPRPIEAGPPFWAGLSARADDTGVATVELSAEGTRVTSFAELEGRVVQLAAGLTTLGVRPGDRVALLIRPGLDLMATVYACWRVGAAIVLADAGLGLRNLGNALRSTNPAYVIGIPAGLAVAKVLKVPGKRLTVADVVAHALRQAQGNGTEAQGNGVAAQGNGTAAQGNGTAAQGNGTAAQGNGTEAQDNGTEAQDNGTAAQGNVGGAQGGGEAAVLFTSGATGPAKGVVYRQDQLRAQLEGVRRVMRIGPQDRLVAAFAPFALYGPALGVAAAVPDMDVTKPGTLTAVKLAEAVRAVDATVLFASPAALRNVAATADELSGEHRTALGGVRTVLSAGAPVPLPLLRRVQEVLPNAELHTPYGMTECLPVADISLTQIEEAGTGNGVCVGHAIPGVEIRISALDPTGAATGPLGTEPNTTGEVCVAGPHVKQRYDRLWATERQSSRDPGWHRTGDVGHFDDAGRLWVEGRLVHVITAPDGPLTPVGIEQRVEALPGVEAAAAVGVGPPGTQQLVLVIVATESGAGPLATPAFAAAVREAAGEPVAAVLTVAALPVDIRHASKVDRARLARWATRVLHGGRVGRP